MGTTQLMGSSAGNTHSFGQVWEGRPFWIGNFSRADRAQVLYHDPAEGNWWLGTDDGNRLVWSFAGNTSGFGDVADGRPFRIGDFTGNGRANVLFFHPDDGHWWLGVYDGNQLVWRLADDADNLGEVLSSSGSQAA